MTTVDQAAREAAIRKLFGQPDPTPVTQDADEHLTMRDLDDGKSSQLDPDRPSAWETAGA